MVKGKENDHYYLLAVVTIVGFALRQMYLVGHDAWWDEICTATRALLPLSDLWTSLKFQGPSPVSVDSSPPLSHIFIHFSLLWGQTGYYLKLPNTIFGALTLPAVYFLGRQLANPRVGLIAATFIAFSSFHVSYSRDARWYSLFYSASIFAFYFFVVALKKSRSWKWVGLTMSSVMMLYTSYMAIVFLASFVVSFGVWIFVSNAEWQYKRGVIIRFLLSVVSVVVLFSPWIEGQLNAYHALYSDAARPEFSWLGFLDLLRSTISPTYYTGIDTKPIIAVILACGVAAFLISKKYYELFVLCLWAVLPLISAYNVKTANTISPKYILFMLFVIALFLAMALDLITGILVYRLKNNETIRLWLAMSLVLGGSYFSVQFYPEHLIEGIHNDKSAASYAAQEKYNSEYMLFTRSRHHKAIMDWYLPGVFKQLDVISDLKYRRYLLVNGAGPGAEDNTYTSRVGQFVFSHGGIVNRSPLVIDPDSTGEYVYCDNFSDHAMYSDASYFTNLCVSLTHKVLELYDLNKSGKLEYEFVNPSGNDLRQMRFDANVVLERGTYIDPDCTVLISVTNSIGEKKVVKSVDATLFPAEGGAIDVSSSFDTEFLGRGPVKLSLEFSRGVRAGILGVRKFRVAFQQDSNQESRYDAVSIYSHNISQHTQLTTWNKSVWPINPPGPYVFQVAQPGGSLALKEFKSRYPDAQPIYALKSKQGEAQVLYFDPWCEDPFLRLRAGQDKKRISFAPSNQGTYILRGAMDFPVLHSGGNVWPITLKTPPETVATIIPNGQGRLSLRPLFTEKAFSPSQMERYNSIKKLRNEDCLTCASNSSCQIVYSFQSIFPVQEIRVVWYPRLHSDVARKNSVVLSVSVDGLPPKTLDCYKSRGTDSWDGPVRKVNTLKLEKTANKFEVIFDLQNDATQIWSVSDMVMTIDAKIDTRTAPNINFADGDQVWVEGDRKNDFGIFFPKEKHVFHDNLEYMN